MIRVQICWKYELHQKIWSKQHSYGQVNTFADWFILATVFSVTSCSTFWPLIILDLSTILVNGKWRKSVSKDSYPVQGQSNWWYCGLFLLSLVSSLVSSSLWHQHFYLPSVCLGCCQHPGPRSRPCGCRFWFKWDVSSGSPIWKESGADCGELQELQEAGEVDKSHLPRALGSGEREPREIEGKEGLGGAEAAPR